MKQHQIFLLKKQLVDEPLTVATIDRDRNIQVEFRAKIISGSEQRNTEFSQWKRNCSSGVERNSNNSGTQQKSTLTILDYQGAFL